MVNFIMKIIRKRLDGHQTFSEVESWETLSVSEADTNAFFTFSHLFSNLISLRRVKHFLLFVSLLGIRILHQLKHNVYVLLCHAFHKRFNFESKY